MLLEAENTVVKAQLTQLQRGQYSFHPSTSKFLNLRLSSSELMILEINLLSKYKFKKWIWKKKSDFYNYRIKSRIWKHWPCKTSQFGQYLLLENLVITRIAHSNQREDLNQLTAMADIETQAKTISIKIKVIERSEIGETENNHWARNRMDSVLH